MRIGIFSESYEPVQNGVTTSVRTLVDELRARHHHVSIFAPHYPDFDDTSPFVMRVPSLLTRWNADYPVPYPVFPKIRRDVGKLRLDILHSQSPWFLGLLAARLARQHRTPLISTYHTLYDYYGHYLFLPDVAVKNLLEWWMPEYYNRCARVIVPSEVAKNNLRHYDVTTPIEVIPTGVPLPCADDVSEAAQRKARARWNIPFSAPLLLYVGRIAQEKNLELLLDAFEAIAAQFPEAYLLIVGGGPHLEECQAKGEAMACGSQIIFAGPVERDDLDPVYAAADLFVFGSSTETQGMVVAEARAAGTPCVVVNEGGACEAVRDGEDGLIVPPEPEAFAGALRRLLQHPERIAVMSEQCRRNALRFTPSVMAERVLAVYQHTLDDHARLPASALDSHDPVR
jgi:glycosyltransferase involved in cell wall biosynthesis